MFKTQKTDASGQQSNEKVVGYFKGIIEIESKEEKFRYEKDKSRLIE